MRLKMKSIALIFVLNAFCYWNINTLCLAQAQEKPLWIKVWEDAVARTKNSEWEKWLKEISTPEAIELGKAWAEYLGYDAVSLLMKANPAPDIKPGLVIDGENYKDFPGLKKLLPGPLYERIKKGTYAQLAEIRIVPTTHMYDSWGMLKYTKEGEGKCRLDSRNMLQGWKAGNPFPRPKNGAELIWAFDRKGFADNLSFNPITFLLFDKNEKQERSLIGYLYWWKSMGRVNREPMPVDREGVYEYGSIVFTYPFDVKGFAAVRTRYEDPDKPDYFIAWLPSLRRTRLFSGTDTQDPMFGSDVAWDDWKVMWQKISADIYPNEYDIVGETFILAPVWRNYPFKVLKGKFYLDWEIRPVWILDVISKDKSYQYSKRRMWIDKEIYLPRYAELYDQRGNNWRDWLTLWGWDPKTGYLSAWGAEVIDVINKHRTLCVMNPIFEDPSLNQDHFNLRALVKMAR